MLVAELEFKIIADTSFAEAEQGIRHYLEKLIFQGQILGREFPTYQAKDIFSAEWFCRNLTHWTKIT